MRIDGLIKGDNMEITKKTDYALRAIRAISNSGRKVINAKAIAEIETIPIPFLLKVLRELSRADILLVHRGVNGGYSLAKTLDCIFLYDVIILFEGEYSLSGKIATQCSLKHELHRVDTVIRDELYRYPLSELI